MEHLQTSRNFSLIVKTLLILFIDADSSVELLVPSCGPAVWFRVRSLGRSLQLGVARLQRHDVALPHAQQISHRLNRRTL